MPTRIQENFPLQRLDVFSHPTQDDYERAKEKARQLLHQILPENAWTELEEKGVIRLTGKRGSYVISPYSQTEFETHLQAGASRMHVFSFQYPHRPMTAWLPSIF